MNEPAPKPCPQCGAPLPPDAHGGLCPRCLMAMNLATPTEFTGEVGPQGTKVVKTPPPEPSELATKFPQLEILELLGQGGMGAVYKARQKELDRIVALKILPPGVGADAAFAERFAREAKALARLNHPGIVTLYEFGRADGLFYFLMEFVDGVNLQQLLKRERIAAREALAIVPQICDALQYAHDQGIVHRDIKPENVLLDRKGRVKVADFGLARLVGGTEAGGPGVNSPASASLPSAGTPLTTQLTDPGRIMGTPQYMAPEQMERPLEVDHRADIYSLGVVLYQMLTGELPGKRIEPPSRKVQIDVRLDEVVLRALEKKPELRYQQASVLKTQVETIAATPSPSSSRPVLRSPDPIGTEGGREEAHTEAPEPPQTQPEPARQETQSNSFGPISKTIALRLASAVVINVLWTKLFYRLHPGWTESLFFVVWAGLSLWVGWPLFRCFRRPLNLSTGLAASLVVFFALWVTTAIYGPAGSKFRKFGWPRPSPQVHAGDRSVLPMELRSNATANPFPGGPHFRARLTDEGGLDLDTGRIETPWQKEDGVFKGFEGMDVAWDDDEDGMFHQTPDLSVKFLPLESAVDFSDAAVKAVQGLDDLRKSLRVGFPAKQCRFFAVLTDDRNLAVIEVTDPSEKEGTIHWSIGRLDVRGDGVKVEPYQLLQKAGAPSTTSGE